MQQQIVKFVTEDHPVLSAVTAAGLFTATLYFLYQQQRKSAKSNEIIQLTNQGPEFQIVRAIELMGKYYKVETCKTMSSSTGNVVEGLSRFLFRRDEVGQFFNKNEELLALMFPIPETLSNIHSILADTANEAQILEKRRKESFDNENSSHVEMLKKLWELGIINRSSNDDNAAAAFERTSSKWDLLGFQGTDPATDLRGGGMLSLDIFLDFVEKNNDLVKAMQAHNEKKHKEGSQNWMLIACASIHVSVNLFKQIGDGNNNFCIWTRPLLMAIFRGAAVMKFHPKAKIPDEFRAGFMPTPKDYDTGLVRVAVANVHNETAESETVLSEDFDLNAAEANSPQRMRSSSSSSSAQQQQQSLLLSSNNKDEKSSYPRIRTGKMNQWTLFSSVCRVHHFLMRRLFEEWIEKEPSIMEFENFVLKNVYEPFFESKNPVLL